MLLTPPRTLPVGHLSLSSVNLYLKCPERWRRRYILNEFEPTSAAALLGRSVGAAERDHYGQVVETGRGLSERDVLDAFSDAWALEQERPENEQVDWEGVKPGRWKDQGVKVLPVYHRAVAPTVRPIAVERQFVVTPADVDWTFEGYFDVEETDAVDDLKVRSRSKGVVTAAEARVDLQPTSYLFARRAEARSEAQERGEAIPPAARFRFHSMVRPPVGGKSTPRDVLVTPTERSDAALDQFLDLLYRVAAEIQWRLEYDVWTGPPPGAWWCASDWCGFWHTCPLGGQFAPALQLPRPARKPRASHARAAIEATRVQGGYTTAAKVAAYLGVSTRSAAGLLNAEVRAGRVVSTKPTKSTGRGKDKVTVQVRGPQRYSLPAPVQAVEPAAA